MKKILIVSVVVFLAIFLLWPTYKYGEITECNDTGPISELHDCINPEAFSTLGGGVLYIAKVISSGQFKSADHSNYATYEIVDDIDNLRFFHPIDALKVALLSGIGVGVIVYVVQRTRRSKAR